MGNRKLMPICRNVSSEMIFVSERESLGALSCVKRMRVAVEEVLQGFVLASEL